MSLYQIGISNNNQRDDKIKIKISTNVEGDARNLPSKLSNQRLKSLLPKLITCVHYNGCCFHLLFFI